MKNKHKVAIGTLLLYDDNMVKGLPPGNRAYHGLVVGYGKEWYGELYYLTAWFFKEKEGVQFYEREEPTVIQWADYAKKNST